jgi:hypothetical protein
VPTMLRTMAHQPAIFETIIPRDKPANPA